MKNHNSKRGSLAIGMMVATLWFVGLWTIMAFDPDPNDNLKYSLPPAQFYAFEKEHETYYTVHAVWVVGGVITFCCFNPIGWALLIGFMAPGRKR